MKVKCDICGQKFEKIYQDDMFCDKCLYQINLEQAETKDKLVLFLKSEWYDKIEAVPENSRIPSAECALAQTA